MYNSNIRNITAVFYYITRDDLVDLLKKCADLKILNTVKPHLTAAPKLRAPRFFDQFLKERTFRLLSATNN